MMRCRTVQPHLLDFCLGRLNPGAARGIAAHLEGCAECRALQQREQEIAALLGSATPVAPAVDAWSAVEIGLRHTSLSGHRRRVLHAPLLWAGGLTAAATLAVGLVSPVRSVIEPSLETEALRTLTPAVAAGLGPDRGSDPLLAVQHRMDLLLDGVVEQGS